MVANKHLSNPSFTFLAGSLSGEPELGTTEPWAWLSKAAVLALHSLDHSALVAMTTGSQSTPGRPDPEPRPVLA